MLMKWKCDLRSCNCNLSNRKVSPKNVFGASTGYEPMASALALQCSTNWAMKTNTLGTGQFVEFIVPLKGMRYMNIMWTADIRMKWRCDHRSCNCDLSNRKVSAKNVFGASTGLEPMATAMITSFFHSHVRSSHNIHIYHNANAEAMGWDIRMKWRCDHRSCNCDLSNRKVSPKNVFGASTGFEPIATTMITSLFYSHVRSSHHIHMSHNANAEAMGSNPVENLVPKTFLGLSLRLLKSKLQLRWSHFHFIRMSAVHIIFISNAYVEHSSRHK